MLAIYRGNFLESMHSNKHE